MLSSWRSTWFCCKTMKQGKFSYQAFILLESYYINIFGNNLEKWADTGMTTFTDGIILRKQIWPVRHRGISQSGVTVWQSDKLNSVTLTGKKTCTGGWAVWITVYIPSAVQPADWKKWGLLDHTWNTESSFGLPVQERLGNCESSGGPHRWWQLECLSFKERLEMTEDLSSLKKIWHWKPSSIS